MVLTILVVSFIGGKHSVNVVSLTGTWGFQSRILSQCHQYNQDVGLQCHLLRYILGYARILNDLNNATSVKCMASYYVDGV
jgi:hypothetical protein